MSDSDPIVFISYSHDNEEHNNWVLQLAKRLRSNGVDVILDQWNLRLGNGLPIFMERGLSNSHRVICVCTKLYVEKANNGRAGVGYEKNIIAAEMLGNGDNNWVIPLIVNNEEEAQMMN